MLSDLVTTRMSVANNCFTVTVWYYVDMNKSTIEAIIIIFALAMLVLSLTGDGGHSLYLLHGGG